MAPALALMRQGGLPAVLLVALAPPSALAGQAARVAAVEPALTQSLLDTQRDWRGPGLRAAYRVPRTPAVDAGVEIGVFHAGTREEAFTYRSPAGTDVLRTERESLVFGFVALAARYHLDAGRVHPVLTGTVGMYGARRVRRFDERTPAGAPLTADALLARKTDFVPGVGAGAGVVGELNGALRFEAELRLHAAITDGFPAAMLSLGLARVLGRPRGGT